MFMFIAVDRFGCLYEMPIVVPTAEDAHLVVDAYFGDLGVVYARLVEV